MVPFRPPATANNTTTAPPRSDTDSIRAAMQRAALSAAAAAAAAASGGADAPAPAAAAAIKPESGLLSPSQEPFSASQLDQLLNPQAPPPLSQLLPEPDAVGGDLLCQTQPGSQSLQREMELALAIKPPPPAAAAAAAAGPAAAAAAAVAALAAAAVPDAPAAVAAPTVPADLAAAAAAAPAQQQQQQHAAPLPGAGGAAAQSPSVVMPALPLAPLQLQVSPGAVAAAAQHGGRHASVAKLEHIGSVAKRRGPMDEMRQLQRIMTKLMPESLRFVPNASEGGGNKVQALDIKVYLAATLGEAPKPDWGLKAGWGQYLADLFNWATGRSDISNFDAMECAHRQQGRSWELAYDKLMQLGVYSWNWELPLKLVQVRNCSRTPPPELQREQEALAAATMAAPGASGGGAGHDAAASGVGKRASSSAAAAAAAAAEEQAAKVRRTALTSPRASSDAAAAAAAAAAALPWPLPPQAELQAASCQQLLDWACGAVGAAAEAVHAKGGAAGAAELQHCGASVAAATQRLVVLCTQLQDAVAALQHMQQQPEQHAAPAVNGLPPGTAAGSPKPISHAAARGSGGGGGGERPLAAPPQTQGSGGGGSGSGSSGGRGRAASSAVAADADAEADAPAGAVQLHRDDELHYAAAGVLCGLRRPGSRGGSSKTNGGGAGR